MEVDEVKQMHLNARGGERWRGSAQWIVIVSSSLRHRTHTRSLTPLPPMSLTGTPRRSDSSMSCVLRASSQ